MLRITTKQHHPAGGCWGATQSAHGQFCTPRTSGEGHLPTENGPKTRPQLATPSVYRPPIEGYRRYSPTGWTYRCLWVHRPRKCEEVRTGAHIAPFRGSALGMAKPGRSEGQRSLWAPSHRPMCAQVGGAIAPPPEDTHNPSACGAQAPCSPPRTPIRPPPRVLPTSTALLRGSRAMAPAKGVAPMIK